MNESKITICGHGSNTPSTKNMYSYLQSRYESRCNDGQRKELVAVRRKKNLTSELEKKFHDTYAKILGRNIYSQSLRQYIYSPYKDGKYYSDCSSSGCGTYKVIGLACPLFNCAEIYKNDVYFEDVDVTIKNGHIMNPDILRTGDALLFRGNTAGRPLGISHVEYVYEFQTDTIKEVTGTVTVTTDSNLRNGPDGQIVGLAKTDSKLEVSQKCGKWLNTDKGWISRNLVIGWLFEDDHGEARKWYLEKGTYPSSCVKEIDGKLYAFDKEGWAVNKYHINDDCSID